MQPNERIVNRIKELYPEGCLVELDKMDDEHAPPIGTQGTVVYVDSMGTIDVEWDNGSSLSVAFGKDQCHKV